MMLQLPETLHSGQKKIIQNALKDTVFYRIIEYKICYFWIKADGLARCLFALSWHTDDADKTDLPG